MSPSPVIQYDQYGNPIPQASAPVGMAPTSAPAPNSIYGNSYAAQIPNIDSDPSSSMQSRFTTNQDIIGAQGTQLSNEEQAAEGYYGGLQPQYQTQEDSALSTLLGQPGYTPQQAGQINVDYSQFNTPGATQTAELGNTATGVQSAQTGEANEGAQLNAYDANLSGQVGNYDTGVGAATSGLDAGLDASQNFGLLNSAVSNPNLAFDPNNTEQQVSDQEVGQIATQAGEAVGAQYQGAEQQLQQQAAAAGNTSPLAIAAANARLQTQESAQSGQAMTAAELAAKQYQLQAAQSIEGQREGAVQTQSGMQATAGTTEEAASQAAAGLAGTTGVSAAEAAGQAGIGASENYGTEAINEQNTMTGQDYTAQTAADAANVARQQTLAGQNYTQGTTSAGLTSAGAANVGQTAITGMNNYRSGVAGQEGVAQQGGESALGQQNTTYGTETSGVNSSANSQGNFINNKPSLGDSVASGAANGALGLVGLDSGGIVTEPTTAKIAERGPEMVVPLTRLGRYRAKRNPFQGTEAA